MAHHHRQRYRCMLMGALLFALLYLPLRAQDHPPAAMPPPAPPPEQQSARTLSPADCEGCYKGFRFDSTFRIGAHFNGAWPTAMKMVKDTLHIEITQLYNQRSSLQRYLDSTQWETVWPDSATDNATWKVYKRVRWIDSLNRQFWRGIRSADMKVIMGPGWIPVISKALERSDAYYGQAGKDTYIKGDWDNPGNDTLQRLDYMDYAIADSFDRAQNSFIWGGAFNRSQSDTLPLPMVSGHVYTNLGLTVPDTNLYAAIGHKADTGVYDVTVAVKTGTIPQAMPDSTILAYVNIYRRIPVGQNICGCNLYEIVDSLMITKDVYLNHSDTTIGNGYREIVLSLRFPNPTFYSASPLIITRKPGSAVTALAGGATYEKYTRRGGFFYWNGNGNYQGADAANDTTAEKYRVYCRMLKDSLVARNYYNASRVIDRPQTITYGDISYDVFTTRKVDVTFLRGRIVPHAYTLLRQKAFDSLMRADIDSVYADTTLRPQIFRFGVVDEHAIEKYRAYAEVTSRVQRALFRADSIRTDSLGIRGIWANPMSHAPGFRIFTGDLDTTEIKMVHMAANQIYNFGGRIPIFYANPDSMTYRSGADSGKYSKAIIDGLYRTKPQVPSPDFWLKDRMVAFNTLNEHKVYSDSIIHAIDLRRDQLVDMVNTSRFTFNHIRSQAYPVYSVVQVHGYLEADGNGYTQEWHNFRPPTPQEITVQAWMVLHCGLDGMWFSDFVYDDAREFGVMHWLTGDHSKNYQDTLNSGDVYKANPSGWKLPLMWTGFHDRFNAVKRITDEFHDNILPVYRKLDRNGIRMAVYRDVGFHAMPMLDTLYTRRAALRKDLLGGYQDSLNGTTPVNDAQGDTYIEATLFNPGPLDTNRTSRYLLVTNLRCWPVDTLTYSGRINDSLFATNQAAGYGAIDVRKPIVILKNTTNVIADSFLLQRIGSGTSRTVRAGDTVHLEWLEPGWGKMYRITPVVTPVSGYGTAYNNGVHGENPSTDAGKKDRIVVYERDSAIYLRTMDSTGDWGREFLVSDPTDTASVGAMKRVANNLFPTFASVRNGESCVVVWERRDNLNRGTVEMRRISMLPTRGSATLGSTARLRLSPPRSYQYSWMQLTPSVVGLDSGYLVAWAAPDFTVEVKAVRDTLTGSSYDTSRTMRVALTAVPPRTNHPDSATAYPTLAYVRNYSTVRLNGGRLSSSTSNPAESRMPRDTVTIPDTLGTYHIAHLAYQQGPRTADAWRIMYNTIGVRFHDPASSLYPQLWASFAEPVTAKLSGCSFIHPSIAADSLRTGVAFVREGSSKSVLLRFRKEDATRELRWATETYRWGGSDTIGHDRNGDPSDTIPIILARNYDRPSLLMFPARDMAGRSGAYEGGLVWHWTNASDGRRHHQLIYRFGEVSVDTIPDGQHPMMLGVPYIRSTAQSAFAAASVMHRGTDSQGYMRPKPGFGARMYYPAYLENTPPDPQSVFNLSSTYTKMIHASYAFKASSIEFSGPCASVDRGIEVGILYRRDSLTTRRKDDVRDWPFGPYAPPDPPFIPPPPGPPVLPRIPRVMTHPTMGMDIARTQEFTAADSAVTVIRTIRGSDSLIAWLNTQPWDSSSNWPVPIQANIFITTQLVRASDSTILWSSDTISARGVGGDMLMEEVEVPVYLAASPGTGVFIQVATVPTENLQYDLSAEYHFIEDGMPGGSLLKSVRKGEPNATAGGAAAIEVDLMPNPVRFGSGSLQLRFNAPGEAKITISNLAGQIVQTFAPYQVGRAGEHSLPVDLSGLANGIYIVRVEMGGSRGSTRFTVVR